MVGLAADELATEVAQLPDEASAVAVYGGCLLRHRGHDFVEVPLDQPAGPQRRGWMDDRRPTDDQPDPSACEPLEVLDVSVRRNPALDQAGARGQRHEPVPQIEPTEPERREDVRKPVVHPVLLRCCLLYTSDAADDLL